MYSGIQMNIDIGPQIRISFHFALLNRIHIIVVRTRIRITGIWIEVCSLIQNNIRVRYVSGFMAEAKVLVLDPSLIVSELHPVKIKYRSGSQY